MPSQQRALAEAPAWRATLSLEALWWRRAWRSLWLATWCRWRRAALGLLALQGQEQDGLVGDALQELQGQARAQLSQLSVCLQLQLPPPEQQQQQQQQQQCLPRSSAW